MINTSANSDLLRSDLRRMVRFHSREELADRIADYVETNYSRPVEGERKAIVAITPERIKLVVMLHFNVTLNEITVKSRKRSVVYPRKALMYLLATRTNLTLEAIGEIVNRHYSSVVHCRDDMSDLMASDPAIKEEMNLLNSQL